MVSKLYTRDADFSASLAALLGLRQSGQADIVGSVAAIIQDVREHGDAALKKMTLQWDRFACEHIRLSDNARAEASAQCSAETRKSLQHAADRIAAYSTRQMPEDVRYQDALGVTLGWQWRAVNSAGLYVPGGSAAYPSSVLMNAVVARTAGVKRLVVTVPTPEGVINPSVMAACDIAGVDEIYTIGGAQAIAALAFGTETIAPVAVVVGPGNAFVAEAKRQVFGHVGIDMIAGPSEVLIVTDRTTPARWIAYDLLSQAEHDAQAQSIVITDDEAYAEEIIQAVDTALATLPRKNIAAASWQQFGAVIIAQHILSDAPALINRIAPEHLQLATEHAEAIASGVHHAGAIFMGRMTPEAIGDYIAGPSHVLPTHGTARFASGLSVFDFLKRSSIIGCDHHGFQALAGEAAALAASEGLHAHQASVTCRMEQP